MLTLQAWISACIQDSTIIFRCQGESCGALHSFQPLCRCTFRSYLSVITVPSCVRDGGQTAYGTQLTNAEVDEVFNDLGIAEHDAVDYEQFVLALTSGFVQMEVD